MVEFAIGGRLSRGARAASSRRRGKVLEAAILEAALQELAEAGYINFSIERVAARAGASKPAIYRRRPARARLVYAAWRADRPVLSSEAPDTGTVRGDIMDLHRVSEMVDELGPEVIFGLIAELVHESDSSLFAEARERSAEIMMEILTRGVKRGEIAAAKLTPRLAALPFDLRASSARAAAYAPACPFATVLSGFKFKIRTGTLKKETILWRIINPVTGSYCLSESSLF